MNGYAGTILDVDLGARRARPVPLDPELARDYLGGRGLGVRLLWDALPSPRTDPLGPGNPVVFATGPLTGFPVVGANRTSVVTKSPATSPRSAQPGASSLAIGQMPGHFATELKYAGYDALVVRGRAPEPLALIIRDGDVTFRPAQDLWGHEVPDAEAALRADLPNEPFQTLLIGPAGERRHPFATAVAAHPYGATAGRGGIGAVLGSKQLKGIAVRGTRTPFDAAQPTEFDKRALAATERLKGWNRYETWRRYGTAALVEAGSDAGIIAVRNFREGVCPQVAAIGGVRAAGTAWIRSEACYYCPLHCRKVALVRDDHGSGRAVAGPEFETSVMLGANCGVSDLGGVLTLKDRCDRLGLEPSSVGNYLGFVTEACKAGLLSASALGARVPDWGDTASLLALVDGMGTGGGAGSNLPAGVRALAKTLGGEALKWAMEVKGLEMDSYNPPGLPALAVSFGTSPVGAAHEFGHTPAVQDERAVADALGLCRFHSYANPLEAQAGLLETVTGANRSPEDLRAVGSRIWNLERAFLVREGFGAVDDRLPERCRVDAFTRGPRVGSSLTAETEVGLLEDYYHARGWDPHSGAPLPETLRKLGLADVAEALRAG